MFGPGERPDMRALRAAVADVTGLTLAQELRDTEGGPPAGCELLHAGMTFDLIGLAPGEGAGFPLPVHRFGPPDAEPADLRGCEAIALQPGPHLVAGARGLPVMKGLLAVASALLVGVPQARGAIWPPARAFLAPDYLASIARAWLDRGAFPAPGLAALADTSDGGLCSQGLAWFAGQELRIAPALAKDRAAGIRLGLRLIERLAAEGRITAQQAAMGPDGDRIVLEPTRAGTVVRVRRG